MATVNLFNPHFDMTGIVSRHWTASATTSSRLTYESDGHQLIVQGTFTTDDHGDVTGGTVSSIVWKESANIETASLRLSDLSLDAKALATQIPLAGNDSQLLSFLLGGNDTITGSAFGDRLQGFGGNDTIDAGAGDDFIADGPGNDTVDGGTGFDIVGYGGKLGDYVIERTEHGVKVTHPVFSTDGTQPSDVDNIVNVERLYFSDKHVALIDANSTGGTVFRMYEAAFGRAPEEAGLDYWTAQMDTNGLKLRALAANFVASDEYRTMYGTNTSNHDLVVKFYDHILHRAPDEGGLAYWTDVLDNHKASQAEVLAAISDSAESVELSVTLIGSGLVMEPPVFTA